MSNFFAQLVVNVFFGRDHLAGFPVGDEEEAVAIGLHQDRRVGSADLQVGQQQFVDAVIVPGVGRRALDVPLDLAGVGVDGESRCGIKVRQLAEVAIPGRAHAGVPGSRIAGPPVHSIGLRIVGADQPGRAAAVKAGVALPRVATGLTRRRDGIGLPELLAVVQIERQKCAAYAVFATAEAGDDLVANDERRRGDDGTLLVVDDLRSPKLLAAGGIERRELAIQPADENLAIGIGDATVVDVAACVLQHVIRHIRLIGPFFRPGGGVYRVDIFRSPRRRDVECVPDHDRRRFVGTK